MPPLLVVFRCVVVPSKAGGHADEVHRTPAVTVTGPDAGGELPGREVVGQ